MLHKPTSKVGAPGYVESMSGDKLSLVLFFVGTGIAAVMGALQTAGWRSKVFWAIALVLAVLGLAYYRYAASGQVFLAVRTVYSLIPFIAVVMCVLIVDGREPIKRAKPLPEKPTEPPVLNPALTAGYFNDIVKYSTEFEANRKITEHANQLMVLKAQALDVLGENGLGYISVKAAGLTEKYGQYDIDAIDMRFRMDQKHALAAIKQGDWIEFMGKPRASGPFGWRLVECEFLGLTTDPRPKPKPKSKRMVKPKTL